MTPVTESKMYEAARTHDQCDQMWVQLMQLNMMEKPSFSACQLILGLIYAQY